MSVNSRITSTTIMQRIESPMITCSNRLECVCSGGNSIWRLSSSICGSPPRCVRLDAAGGDAHDRTAVVEPAVLPIDPVHEHDDRHDDADDGEDVVAAGGAGALVAVGASRPERHDAGALLVGGSDDEVRRVVGRLGAGDARDAV